MRERTARIQFKRHGERWALGYLSFRLVEAMVLIVSKFNVLALIDVSQAYLATTAADATYFQTIGTLTLAQRDWASQLQVVFFVLSALIFYTVLYQTRLLPRFIAIWGFVAVIGLIAANVYSERVL